MIETFQVVVPFPRRFTRLSHRVSLEVVVLNWIQKNGQTFCMTVRAPKLHVVSDSLVWGTMLSSSESGGVQSLLCELDPPNIKPFAYRTHPIFFHMYSMFLPYVFRIFSISFRIFSIRIFIFFYMSSIFSTFIPYLFHNFPHSGNHETHILSIFFPH